MTHDELIALRCAVQLAERHIRNGPRGRWRLEWMRLLRVARHALREVTHDFLDKEAEAK